MNQQSDVTSDLEAVRSQFSQWRKTRKKGSRIPEPLWSAAVSLTRVYSLTEISQSLKLEFNQLKRRCSAVETGEFVELRLPAPKECLIEVERADGARLRIRGAVDARVIELAKAFCQ